jgi:hypothetical protein
MAIEWTFYTYITPDKTDNVQNIAFNESFETFFNDITSNTTDLLKKLKDMPKYRYTINLSDTNNIVSHNYMDLYTFYKERFLNNKMFKSRLLSHYNQHDIIMKGPYFKKKNMWIIEYMLK